MLKQKDFSGHLDWCARCCNPFAASLAFSEFLFVHLYVQAVWSKQLMEFRRPDHVHMPVEKTFNAQDFMSWRLGCWQRPPARGSVVAAGSHGKDQSESSRWEQCQDLTVVNHIDMIQPSWVCFFCDSWLASQLQLVHFHPLNASRLPPKREFGVLNVANSSGSSQTSTFGLRLVHSGT